MPVIPVQLLMSLFENKQKRLLYCEYYEAIFWAAWTPAYKVRICTSYTLQCEHQWQQPTSSTGADSEGFGVWGLGDSVETPLWLKISFSWETFG